MKYCVVEIVKMKSATIKYDLDIPFVYGKKEVVRVMRMWCPDEAKDIKLFNTIKEAAFFISKNFSGEKDSFKVVPHEDVKVCIAEMKLRRT
jgi:hypothetical protein